jgi:hypothetical protein
MAMGLLLVGAQLAACQHPPVKHEVEHPAHVEAIEGSDLRRVTFTDRAIERVGLQTTVVREQPVTRSPSPRRVVPDTALIYDPEGQTWVYVSPEPRTFIRHRVGVDYVEAGVAVLNDGPPVGTVVVSMAAVEVYGADFGVGH